FDDTDQTDTAPVAILNEALAKRLFGDEDPLGRYVSWTGEVLPAIGMTERWKTVVGVVSNTRDDGPGAEPPLVMYQPLTQNDLGYFPGAFVIRANGAHALAPRVQQIANELAPDQPVLRVATLEQIREETVAAERLNTFLGGALGMLALVIASVGLAGRRRAVARDVRRGRAARRAVRGRAGGRHAVRCRGDRSMDTRTRARGDDRGRADRHGGGRAACSSGGPADCDTEGELR